MQNPNPNDQQTPLGVAVAFSMAWLETQGMMGDQIARTINTILLGNNDLLQRIEQLEQENATLKADLPQPPTPPTLQKRKGENS